MIKSIRRRGVMTIFIFIFLLATFACKQKKVSESSKIENEILQLKTNEEKKLYLEEIMMDDQRVRDSEISAALMLRYGKDSKEHMDYVRAQWKQDEINLKKIENYLEIHGNPGKEMGSDATAAPWMVIHHAQGYEARERNFEAVYGAYLKGDIDDGAISFYLGRMYDIKYGERLDMESPYTAEDEINLLVKELDLEEQKAKVEKSLN
ncbi:MAG: hypothetical protein HKN68_21205 [Saprospiraceae bacterium]|nr:hypothetical protein [Saprospiraceae bacterium]